MISALYPAPLHRLGFLAVTLTLLFAFEAHPQVTVDFSKVTCRQVFTMRNADQVPIWLSGYYHGQKGNPLLDTEQLKENVKRVQNICTQSENWQRPVMDVIAEIESKNK
jgi:hypothetical protein